MSTISQFFTVMKMHAEHTTVISKEKRKRISDDIDKRKEYRIAHGLEEDDRVKADDAQATEGVENVAVEGAGNVQNGSSEGTAPMRKPKRWLGIW